MKLLYPGKILILSLFSVFLMSRSYSATPPADCGCDVTLKPKTGETELYINGTTLGVKPGNKVCIMGGTYRHIYLINFIGTAEQPITITNCTGVVKVSGNGSYGFLLNGSRNVHVTGSGDPAFEYGILVDGTVISQSVGFAMGERSTDIELDHIELYKTGAGFIYAPTPNCDQATWGSNFTIRNLSYHHNYVHDSGGEAFYIGNTSNTYNLTCNGSAVSVTPQVMHGLKIYNNLIERAGWDGIQVASSPVGVEIFNNVIKQHGLLNRDSQQAGIILGGASSGKVYNNLVLGGTGNSFQCFGVGSVQVYNNVFANGGHNGTATGQHGVMIASRPTPAGYTKLSIQFMNNTIISPKACGVVLYNEHDGVGTGNLFSNNVVVNPGAGASSLAYFDVKLPAADMKLLNNITKPTVAEMMFTDAANNNFRLLAGSIAVDAGMDAGSYGVTKDIINNSRPSGAAFDAGAYEYVTTARVNKAPLASAGNDQSVTLPASQATLSGSGSDTDGSIASFNWKQQSGPSASSIASPANAGTVVSGLNAAGVYEFVLTVTDNEGATATSVVKVTENASSQNPAPGLLKFRYYTFSGTWYSMPSLHALTPVSTGTVDNITLANKTQNDRFAYLWEGFINIPVSGNYTFRTTSDDGSQFWIGSLPGPLVVNDGLHAARDKDGTVTLEAGVYPIAVLYYEQDGGETMILSWKTPQAGSFAQVPTSSFVAAPAKPAPGSGLKYRYYTFSGTWYSMPSLHALTPVATGTVEDITLANKTQEDRFAYLWEGFINIPVSGSYTFRTTSDDGSQFWIGSLPGPLVINDGLHGPQDREGTVSLNAGVYPIAALYYDQIYSDVMVLSWKTPQTGGGFVTIPSSAYVAAPPASAPYVNPAIYAFNTNRLDQVSLDSSKLAMAIGKIAPEAFQPSLVVFPNPATEQVNLRLAHTEKGSVQVNIINALGITVRSNKYRKENVYWQEQLQVSGLRPGFYTIEIKGKALSFKQSFIKK